MEILSGSIRLLATMLANYKQTYAAKVKTADEAVAPIKDKEILVVAMSIGQPPALLKAIADRVRADDLKALQVYYKIAMDPVAKTLLSEGVIEKIDAHSFFIAGPDHAIIKKQAKEGRKLLNFVPVNFSQLPRLIEQIIGVDTFVITVSPMDKGGYFSLGTNNDYASTAARCCKRLIVEVNRHMPRVFGQSQIHVDDVEAIVENDTPLIEAGSAVPSKEELAIGSFVASLVPNGGTIQLGIGKVPSGIALALEKHEDLGIHTELFSSGMADLIGKGVVNGKRKTLHPNKHVFTVAFGTTDSYEFMNDNSAFESYASSYVNDLRVISQHDNFISINTAIEIDLYGQVNAEFIGSHEYSGSGGQFDFVKGASLSKGGKSIIAIQSTAKNGRISSIVPRAAMVTDDRMDVEFVATEYGIVNLRGKSTKARAEALIGIAHPNFRDELTSAARKVTLI